MSKEMTKGEILRVLKANAFMLRRSVIPAVVKGDYSRATSTLSNISKVLTYIETDIFLLQQKEQPEK